MKTLEWWQSKKYNFSPSVSFIVETHNLSDHAIRVVDGVRPYRGGEIIVIDDGSSQDHIEKIVDHMNGTNEFVLRCNDIFSTLTVNRSVSLSRGDLVVKLRDDDIYPGIEWIERAVDLFNKNPDMAILGGRGSMTLPYGWNFECAVPWKPYSDRFQFVQAVNEAPLWFKRSAFMQLGGYNEEYAPFYWSEQEICLRAWLAGLSVGWYNSDVDRCAIETPDRRANKVAIHHESWRKNAKIFESEFAGYLSLINERVHERNAKL